MNYEMLMKADAKQFENLIEKARAISWNHFDKRIQFYSPSFLHYKTDHYVPSPSAFPSISVTGSSCSLRCKHCEGRVLRTMLPALSGKELVELCKDLKSKGAKGCLISGGCSYNGSVPLGKFVDAIAEIKRDLGLTVLVHTGVVNDKLAEELSRASVDAALIDIIGSDETIREIYNLDVTVEDFEKSLMALENAHIPTVPHVLVGLHYGKIKGEIKALKIISNHTPSALIIIAFMPIRGTSMEDVSPPSPIEIGKILLAARFMMPSTPIALGCMRPTGRHRELTDLLAVRSGVNAIAFAAEKAVNLATSLGYDIFFSSECCSQISVDLGRVVATQSK